MPLLEVNKITKKFIGLVALNKVDIKIEQGELVALIGPNGSGKSTLFNVITGFLKPDGGQVIFKGKDITGLPSHKIALLGISRSFQMALVFPKLSLMDNLTLAVQQRQEEDLLGRFFMTKKIQLFEKAALNRAEEILDLIELSDYANEPAASLGHGQLKMFQFGMALMPDPDLLMLDEPSAATDAVMVRKMKKAIVYLHRQGKTILFVEHDMKVVMDIAENIFVLDHGQNIAQGPPDHIKRNQLVIEAYFGRRGLN